MEECYYSYHILWHYFQLTKLGYFQIIGKRKGQYKTIIKYKVSVDPVKHCETYKKKGCSYVDSFLCNMDDCKFNTLEKLKNLKSKRNMMTIKIVNKSKNELPAYSTEQSAGLDLRANLENPVLLQPLERKLIPTGLFIELPVGYEAQIRPRSGLAIKHGITVLNSPGTIDADYRGEICVILVNLSQNDFVIENGERICQMVIAQHSQADWVEVEVLSETIRGEGGFGHTGKK